MQNFRAMRKRVDQIRKIVAAAPARLVFGTAGEATLILLGLDREEQIREVYQPGREVLVGRLALTEAFAVGLLKDQVDGFWKPWTYGVLVETDGQRLGFLVPDNPPWRALAEPGAGAEGGE